MASYGSSRGRLWLVLMTALGAALVSALVFVQWDRPARAIIGGTTVSSGEYPFMAEVWVRNKRGSTTCSGTLIDIDSVLTAAHCFDNIAPLDPGTIKGPRVGVRVGSERRLAVSVFIHPRYNASTSAYDVAVVPLSRGVDATYIKLATEKHNKTLEKPGTLLTATGWGAPSDALRKVKLPVVSDSRAKKLYGAKFFPSLEVAAGGKKGKGVCSGDSGGPLFDSGPIGYGPWTQVGITSAVFGGCGKAGHPDAFAEVNNPNISSFILAAAKREGYPCC